MRATRLVANDSRTVSFVDEEGFVIVRFKDGRGLYGIPVRFPKKGQPMNLFLSDAEWLECDEEKKLTARKSVPGKGILVTDDVAIEDIVFMGFEKIEMGDSI